MKLADQNTLYNHVYNCDDLTPVSIQSVNYLPGAAWHWKNTLSCVHWPSGHSQGYKTYFVSAHDLIIQLRKADSDGKLEKKLRSFVKPRLLIIDEMGYMKLAIGDAHYPVSGHRTTL
ncbi:ATP-binding protein [Fictibacillus enclensis]|nr:ATP-binding protein [Fictibacillus enclensis]MDM5335742.1 ATP-binding protein [Fictibacillus enclensis]